MKFDFISATPGPEGRYPQNLFFHPEQIDGKPALIGTPGLIQFSDPSNESEVRGGICVGSYSYVVCGNTFYKVDSAGTATSKGTINSNSGKAWMEYNGSQIMIVGGTGGWVYDVSADTLTQITADGFPGASSLAYQDTYGIVVRPNTNEIYISDELDFTTWDALDYAPINSIDKLVAVYSAHDELWCFGKDRIEVRYNSGATFPYDPIPGGQIETGLGAAASLAMLDNRLFWLDNQNSIRMAEGHTGTVISTPEINNLISQHPNDDAIGYGFIISGNPFYVICFPSWNKTLMYNVSTNKWNYWSSSPYDSRHRSNCYIDFNGRHIVGDYENGLLYEVDFDTYTDNGTNIRRVKTSPSIRGEHYENIFYHELGVLFKHGTGLTDNVDPQAMLRWSDDMLRTWSNEHWRGIGKIGEYKDRAIWHRMGRSRDRCYELVITDPVEVVIRDAWLKAEKGFA